MNDPVERDPETLAERAAAARALAACNASFRPRYCHRFGQGVGLSAEFVGLLKSLALCQRKGVQLCLQRVREPRGFVVEKGWCDYFEPMFPEIDLGVLGVLNRSWFPLQRLPIASAVARAVLRLGSRAEHFMFDDLAALPDRGAAGAGHERDYWPYMQRLATTLWRYNPQTREAVDALLGDDRDAGDYVAVHVRRGDKSTEAAYVPIERYVDRIRALGGRTPTRVYVATDDARVVRELASALGSRFHCWRNRDVDASGHDQTAFNRASPAARRQETIAFFRDLEMIFRATLFVGSASSNIYYLARYFRANANLVEVEDSGP